MIAVTIGTTSWRQAASLAAGEVQFTGTLVYDTDHITPLMVWDGGLGNMRAMTGPEIAGLPAQKLLNAHPDIVAQLTNTAADRPTTLLRALLLLAMDEINLLRAVVVGVGTLVFDPPSMANATGTTSAPITVTGAAFATDAVDVIAPYSLVGVTATAYVSAANTVVIRLHNGTGAVVNLASGTWTVVVRRQPAMSQRTKAQLLAAMTAAINAGSADA